MSKIDGHPLFIFLLFVSAFKWAVSLLNSIFSKLVDNNTLRFKKVCRTGVGQTFLDIVVYFRVDRILYEFYFCMLSISGGDQGERHRPQGRGADAGRDEVHDAQGAVRDHYGVHEQDAPTLHSLRVSPSML